MHTNNLLLVKKGDEFTLIDVDQTQYDLAPQKNGGNEYIFVLFNNKLNVKLNLIDEDSSIDLKVLYLASGEEQIDIDIKASHLALKTKSSQIIKGILTDKSKVKFHGNIYISKDGQQSDGFQNHRALLLSKKALVESVPELEIYADDVKCAHGSATGPIEKESLFYLMSRGIHQRQAEKILIQSFLNDILPEKYQFIVEEWVEKHV